MKHVGSIFTIIGLMISIHALNGQHESYPVSNKDKNTKPLLQIVSVMNEVGAEIDTWHLQAKDKHGLISNREGYKSTVNDIKQIANDFKWEEPINEGDSIKIEGTRHSLRGQIRESISILTYHNHNHNQYETKISYEMMGHDWLESMKNDIFSLFSTRTSELFLENPSISTCVTGNFNDTMEIAVNTQSKNIMRLLRANFVESLEEESFVSLSAYTNQWDTSITTNHKKMNLQIALRDQGLNKPTRVLIGTPILTAEY